MGEHLLPRSQHPAEATYVAGVESAQGTHQQGLSPSGVDVFDVVAVMVV
jgi:hypothetical protein